MLSGLPPRHRCWCGMQPLLAVVPCYACILPPLSRLPGNTFAVVDLLPQAELRTNIESVLNHLYNKHEEVG